MSFTESIKTCFTKYVTFKGRATRSELWWFYLFSMALVYLLPTVVFFSVQDFFVVIATNLAVSLTIALPMLAVGVRRMHDTNHSGWWLLCPLYPLFLAVKAGDNKANDYGPCADTKTTQLSCPTCGELISSNTEVCPCCAEPTNFELAGKEDYSTDKKVAIVVLCICAAIMIGGFVAGHSFGSMEYPNWEVEADDDTVAFSNDDTYTKEVENTSDNEVTTTPRLLTVTKVDYSFYLKPQAGNTYEPSNMVDGNLATAWAISLDQVNYKNGKIYGPTFTIDCMKLSHVVIRNGYCKNESSYMNNTRALKVILCNAGNVDDEDETASYLYEGTLEDTSEEQVLHINSDLPCNQSIQKVQLIFPSDGLRRGNKWDDLCVTEIEFWGI